ncbi:MAG TPA: hypothetical protein VLO11_15125 [Luteolibacter sp.]|nr:hypothetical protein [Luteolibacter sp.]
MSGPLLVGIDHPALLEFRGPDAVRYLNGQLTQDVRKVAGANVSLPSCVTDAKGRLQFRVWITESPEGNLWVEGAAGTAEELEARLTRYLIADDVEVHDLTGKYELIHLVGSEVPTPPEGVFARTSRRFNADGADWWCPAGAGFELPEGISHLSGDVLEDFRIRHGVPTWGRELEEGLLPPEAGLDATDISYHKGCYIGQEVISRIKYAGKVNKRLVRLDVPEDLPVDDLSLSDPDGREAGRITSVSPLASGGARPALAFLKRGADRIRIAGREVEIRPMDGN